MRNVLFIAPSPCNTMEYVRAAASLDEVRMLGIAQVGRLIVEASLPKPGAPHSNDHDGDGYISVRKPDTEAVTAAIKTISETIGIEYG